MLEQEIKATIFRLFERIAKQNPKLLENMPGVPQCIDETKYINELRNYQLQLQSIIQP
jgi:prephenate dehydrogenase